MPQPASDLARDLRALPKAHLHVHLEGAMRPATLADLARQKGVEVPPVEGFGSFKAFAGMYQAATEVVEDQAGMRRVTREVVEDAAADGAVWIETHFYPSRYVRAFGSAETALELVLDELASAGQDNAVGTGLIMSLDRTAPVDEAIALARLAVHYMDRGVVGVGLANDEADWPPAPFEPAFALAKEAGLLSVPHGGELAGAESVATCITQLQADRVEHGVRAVEDPEVLGLAVERGVCFDVCPSSNLVLGIYPDVASHPLPRLLEAGVPCSLNADDPLLFGPGLLEEYVLCREQMGLDDPALASIATASIAHSAAGPADQQAWQQAAAAWLAG